MVKVPMSSAKKIFVFLSNLSLSISCNFRNNFLYPFFYLISYFSMFFHYNILDSYFRTSIGITTSLIYLYILMNYKAVNFWLIDFYFRY